jgi:hypothetical protein
MSVDRLSANMPQTDAGRLDASQSARRTHETGERAASSGPETARPQVDTVELSAASKGLVERAGASADAPPSGTLSADRLKEVLQRVESSYYDRADVRDKVADRVAKDLGPIKSE